jgi:CO dehydrogenase/acetyl-CoA synthase beta subunit
VEEDYKDYEDDEDDKEEEEEEEEEEDDEDGILPNPYVSKSITIIINKVNGIRVTVYNNNINYKMSRFTN